MAKLNFVVFGLMCSFASTNSYVVTVPDDTLFYENELHKPIEDFAKPTEKINREERGPKDEFELIEPEEVKLVYQEVPELQPYPTFVGDIPYHSAPVIPDIPEEEYAIPFYTPDLPSLLSGLDEFMPSMWNDKDSKPDRFLEPDDSISSFQPSMEYFHPFYKSDESLPSIVNGMESSFPRLQDDVFDDELGGIIMRMWMLDYCSIHPECSMDSLQTELRKFDEDLTKD